MDQRFVMEIPYVENPSLDISIFNIKSTVSALHISANNIPLRGPLSDLSFK